MKVKAVPIRSRNGKKRVGRPSTLVESKEIITAANGDHFTTEEIQTTTGLPLKVTGKIIDHQLVGDQGQRNTIQSSPSVTEAGLVDLKLVAENANAKIQEIAQASEPKELIATGDYTTGDEEYRKLVNEQRKAEEMSNKQLKSQILRKIAMQLGIIPTAGGAKSFGTNEYGFDSSKDRMHDANSGREGEGDFRQNMYRNGTLQPVNPDFTSVYGGGSSNSASDQAAEAQNLATDPGGNEREGKPQTVPEASGKNSNVSIKESSGSAPVNAAAAAEISNKMENSKPPKGPDTNYSSIPTNFKYNHKTGENYISVPTGEKVRYLKDFIYHQNSKGEKIKGKAPGTNVPIDEDFSELLNGDLSLEFPISSRETSLGIKKSRTKSGKMGGGSQ